MADDPKKGVTKGAAPELPPATVDPSKMNDEERAAYNEARAKSQRLLDMAGGPMAPPLTPAELLRPGEQGVLCAVPKPPGGSQLTGIPLMLDAAHGHRKVRLPAGTYYLPAWLVTGYPRKAHPRDEAKPGMHPYLEAHGVKIVEPPKAA